MAKTMLFFEGNITDDIKLNRTQSGVAVLNFSLANNRRALNPQTNQWEDRGTTYMRVTVWRELAEHCAASLTKGESALVYGELVQSKYTAKDGTEATSYAIDAALVGPSLQWGTTPGSIQSQRTS